MYAYTYANVCTVCVRWSRGWIQPSPIKILTRSEHSIFLCKMTIKLTFENFCLWIIGDVNVIQQKFSLKKKIAQYRIFNENWMWFWRALPSHRLQNFSRGSICGRVFSFRKFLNTCMHRGGYLNRTYYIDIWIEHTRPQALTLEKFEIQLCIKIDEIHMCIVVCILGCVFSIWISTI